MFTVNGKTITFKARRVPAAGAFPPGSLASLGNVMTDGTGNSTLYLGDPSVATSIATVGDLTTAIDLASGRRYVASVSAGVATLGSVPPAATAAGITTLSSSTGADLSITGKADSLKALNLTAAVGAGDYHAQRGSCDQRCHARQPVEDGSTLNVNGKTITFKNANAAAPAAVPTGSGISNTNLRHGWRRQLDRLPAGRHGRRCRSLPSIIATGIKTVTHRGRCRPPSRTQLVRLLRRSPRTARSSSAPALLPT